MELTSESLEKYGFERDHDRLGSDTNSYFAKDIHLTPIKDAGWAVTLGGLGGYELPYFLVNEEDLEQLYEVVFCKKLSKKNR